MTRADHRTSTRQRRRGALAKVVRGHREDLDLTQERLAARAGWGRQSIGRLEASEHSPSVDRLHLLADAFGITVGALFAEVDAELASYEARQVAS